MSVKPGYEHLKVSQEMAALMRATLVEHYFRAPSDVAVYDPRDDEKRRLWAAFNGEESAGGR